MAVYVPSPFQIDDDATLFAFAERHNFGLLITSTDAEPFTSHLPMLVDRERRLLYGHVARANPHWRLFDGMRKSLAIFTGPHAYVSPSWYAVSPAVPTWNYTAVHAIGCPHVIEDRAAVEELLNRLVTRHESALPQPWKYKLPEDYHAKMLQGIVAFAMPIEHVEGKFKLSQNRSMEDRKRVAERLAQGSAEDQATAAVMAWVKGE